MQKILSFLSTRHALGVQKLWSAEFGDIVGEYLDGCDFVSFADIIAMTHVRHYSSLSALHKQIKAEAARYDISSRHCWSLMSASDLRQYFKSLLKENPKQHYLNIVVQRTINVHINHLWDAITCTGCGQRNCENSCTICVTCRTSHCRQCSEDLDIYKCKHQNHECIFIGFSGMWCNACGYTIEFNDKVYSNRLDNYDLCVDCAKSDEHKAKIMERNLHLDKNYPPLWQQMKLYIGSLLEYVPVYQDCHGDKILLNMAPKSPHYQKVSFIISSEKSFGTFEFFVLRQTSLFDLLDMIQKQNISIVTKIPY